MKRTAMTVLCATLAVASLFLASCKPIIDINGLKNRIDLDSLPALSRFSSSDFHGYDELQEFADDLDAYGYLVAKKFIRDREEIGIYLGGPLDFGAGGDLVQVESSADSGYGTNSQVEGVDELDAVASDGERVFISAGSRILSMDASGALIDSEEPFPGRIVRGLVLCGGRLLAVVDGDWSDNASTTGLALYSIDIDGGLGLLETESRPGYVTGVRSRGQYAYLTYASWIDYSILAGDLYGSLPADGSVSFDLLLAALTRDLETLVPLWRNKVIATIFGTSGRVEPALLEGIMPIIGPDAEGGPEKSVTVYSSFLRLEGIDAAAGLDCRGSSSLFSSGWGWGTGFYCDGSTAVIADNACMETDSGWEDATRLYAFRVEAGSVELASTGSVPGLSPSQFSLDVHEGVLRVASWVGSRWSWDASSAGWTMGSPSRSLVTLLSMETERMSKLGSLDGIGEGEQLYAVRFMGDLGLVVTFLQIDPLFTLDLSNPSEPAIMGELEVTGFSSYLHPMDASHLLAIGQESGGAGNGLQVSIFDVGNPAAPVLDNRLVLPDGSWSDAQWDHHAFRWVADRGILVIPASSWGLDSFSGFLVIDAAPGRPLSELGRVDFSDDLAASGGMGGPWLPDSVVAPRGFVARTSPALDERWYWLASRSLVLGDALITMSGSTVKGNALPGLAALWSVTP